MTTWGEVKTSLDELTKVVAAKRPISTERDQLKAVDIALQHRWHGGSRIEYIEQIMTEREELKKDNARLRHRLQETARGRPRPLSSIEFDHMIDVLLRNVQGAQRCKNDETCIWGDIQHYLSSADTTLTQLRETADKHDPSTRTRKT